MIILLISLYVFGLGFFTIAMTTGTLIGFIATIIKPRIGYTIIFISTIVWLLRYSEHASFLIFYDIENFGRWIMVLIPLSISAVLFGLSLKAVQNERKKEFKFIWIPITLITFISIGLLSFVRKSHINEINCWYYLDNKSDTIKMTFAISPQHKFDALCHSKNLKELILQQGIKYESIDGYYFPESKVKVITSFKKITNVKVMGFRNSETNKKINFENDFEIDINSIKGDKSILKPRFTWGD